MLDPAGDEVMGVEDATLGTHPASKRQQRNARATRDRETRATSIRSWEMAEQDTEAALRWTQSTLQDHAARDAMTASLDLWMWPSDGQDSEGNPEGGHGLHETMFDHVARGGLQAAGSAGGDDHAEIATLGASRARSHSPCDAAIPTMQEAAVPSSRPVRGEPALGGGLGMGTSGRQDGGHTLALDSVQDMPVAVLGSCHALGGGGGSDSGRAEAGSVVVGVVVADGGCGGPGRAADEGVDRVVQGQPEAVLDARGASGGGVQGSADAAASPLANRPLSQRERRRQIRKRNVAKRQASSRPAP